MFALGVELLMRRAIMTRWDNREEPEWPPHPDRVFMALVAAFGETGTDPGERAALEWLERLGAPSIAVSEAASARTTFTSFVPVNDNADPIQKGKPIVPMGSMPIGRSRQPRMFPAAVPESPTFHLVWHADPPADVRPALEAVCAKATYLGHSATPVRVWIEDEDVTPSLVPVEGTAKYRLRVFGKGRLEYLLNRFEAGLRPLPSLWQGYGPPTAAPAAEAAAPFDPALIVLRRITGRRFGLESCGMLADTLRDTLMSRFGADAPEWLTGHQADGAPSRINRLAVVPLGFVGREHADGHLLGLGIAVPTDFPPEQVKRLFDLLLMRESSDPDDMDAEARLELTVNNPVLSRPAGKWVVELDERPFSSRGTTLHPDTWTKPAELWTTVSPLVLPQFPRRGLSSEEVVARACTDAGYPEPADVRTSLAPAMTGVPHTRSFFVRPPKKGQPPRPLIHAVLRFDRPLRGPVLIGAGRYNGFGFCRPIRED